MRLLFTLIVVTFVTVSIGDAHDKPTKSGKKLDHSCCMEKATDGKQKKEAAKGCCSGDKAEMKGKREGMDCCMDHEKAGEAKAKTSEAQKETK